MGKGGIMMADLESVIKGLEKCKRHECDDCTEKGASQAPWDCPAYDDFVDSALALLKEQEAKVIEKVEDLYNEELYYMEIIPHEPVNGMVPGKEQRLFPVVFYGFGIYHTVKNRCYIRVDAQNACETKYLQSRWPMNGYGVWWRCWTKKPTDEQMRAVKWG